MTKIQSKALSLLLALTVVPVIVLLGIYMAAANCSEAAIFGACSLHLVVQSVVAGILAQD